MPRNRYSRAFRMPFSRFTNTRFIFFERDYVNADERTVHSVDRSRTFDDRVEFDRQIPPGRTPDEKRLSTYYGFQTCDSRSLQNERCFNEVRDFRNRIRTFSILSHSKMRSGLTFMKPYPPYGHHRPSLQTVAYVPIGLVGRTSNFVFEFSD